MRNQKSIGILAMTVFCIVVVFLFRQSPEEVVSEGTNPESTPPEESQSLPQETPSPASLADNNDVQIVSEDARFTRFSDGTVHYKSTVASSREIGRNPNPQEDLLIIAQMLSAYRGIFVANPVGSENHEILAQLSGDNPRQLVFLDPNITSLSEDGLLLDRWDTPYQFDVLSSQFISIRSAGPDQEFWTADDLALEADSGS